MDADPDEIRDRLQVVHLDDSLSVSERAVLYAEDPEMGCIGLGEVEAEVVGNAISVVVRYERDASGGPPYVKAPGPVVKKSWTNDRTGMLDRVRDRL